MPRPLFVALLILVGCSNAKSPPVEKASAQIARSVACERLKEAYCMHPSETKYGEADVASCKSHMVEQCCVEGRDCHESIADPGDAPARCAEAIRELTGDDPIPEVCATFLSKRIKKIERP
jgi:hypothetical protein